MVTQLLFLSYQPNRHKGFNFTTTRCSLQLTQRTLTFCARRSLRMTNFIASLILTPKKQNKNSLNTKFQQVASVSIFISSISCFGLTALSSSTKWSKSQLVIQWQYAAGIQGWLLQLVTKPCFHKPHSWKQMLHTSYADRKNQKQVKHVNTVVINLSHNVVVFEIIP